MNYWRRGFDLGNLTYEDESFLAFYKILEYFESKYEPSMTQQAEIIRQEKSKTKRKAMRIAVASGVKKPLEKRKIELLMDCIHIRNTFDIAHMRIKPLPESREGALYFTYIEGVWDTHDHIKELSRLFILRLIGIKELELHVDGGLYRLTNT